jgi:hypothetical protein
MMPVQESVGQAAVVLNPSEAAPPPAVTVELKASEWRALAVEYRSLRCRTTGDSLTWQRFINACLELGLEELARTPATEALELIDGLEG